MKNFAFRVVFVVAFATEVLLLNAQNLIKYVNPFTGTANSKMLTRWGAEGGTYPGAVAPFGFVQLTPETKTGSSRGYDYRDSLICHFSCTGHFSGYPGGSGGIIRIMPLAPNDKSELQPHARPFSHHRELAEPGYYQVLLTDNQTLIETSASVRTGMFRFSFPSGEKPRIFISNIGKTEVRSNQLLKGEFNHTVMEFNVPFTGKEEVASGFILSFPEITGQTVLLKISFSEINFDSSLGNLSSECNSWDFDSFRRINQEKWNKQLSVIEVNDSSDERKTIFYTALYHSLLLPWIISDSKGYYRGADGNVYQTKGANQYGAFSPWDTFRSLHPLLCLQAPDKQNDMIQSALDEFDQTGRLPKGPMTGQHIIPVITDSYLKGIRNFDAGKVLRAMLLTLKRNADKEKDFAGYLQKGYVSYDFPESVTKTLEFGYDDWAVAQMARQLNDTSIYRQYKYQSTNYQKIFHIESKFFLPRKDEKFITEPAGQGYKEGDKWIYSLFVPHDPVALVNFTGGSDFFAQRLDSALTHQLILFDNEPALHVPYLFNFAQRADLTQKWVRTIMENNYSASPGGLPGNDDLGSMSSWYVFSAMGFFPFCPGRPVYELGSPLFKELTIHLPDGKNWTVRSENNSGKNIYVKNIRLNGKNYTSNWISHSTLLAGGEIIFTMDSVPALAFDAAFVNRSETTGYTRIKVTRFEIENTRVAPDQPFTINYRLKNKGNAGTIMLRLTVDGQPYQLQSVWIDAYSVKDGTIECRLYPAGKRKLSLNQLPPKFIAVTAPVNSLPKNKVIVLECPPLLKTGETGTYSYIVKNVGGRTDTAQIRVSLDTKTIVQDKIMLEPGRQKRIDHQIKATEKGRFTLNAGTLSAKINVYDSNTGSEVLHICPVSNSGSDTIPDLSGMGNNGIQKPAGTPEQKLIGFRPSPTLDVFNNTITVMAWVYADRQNDLADLVTKGDHIVIQQNNHQLTFFAGGWGLGDCTVSLPADWLRQWHHMAGVCNGKLLQLYIDGRLVAHTMLDFQPDLHSFSNWIIGGNEEFPGERMFRGKINHIRIYKEALSADEIQQVMGDQN